MDVSTSMPSRKGRGKKAEFTTKMTTKDTRRDDVVQLHLLQELTPPENTKADRPVRRSTRQSNKNPEVVLQNGGTLAPKRLNYSSKENAPGKAVKKRKRTLFEEPSGEKRQKSQMKHKVKKVESDDVDDDEEEEEENTHDVLSEYELERLENIRNNQVFLSSIKLFQAAEELKQMTKPKPSQRGLMRSRDVREVLPPRKSLRLQRIQAETLTLPSEPTAVWTQHVQQTKRPPGVLSMEPTNIDEDSLPPELLTLFTEDSVKEEKVELELKEYRTALESMQISEEGVAKVVKDRIFSAAFHPSTTSLLLATGDKWGRVGLWNHGGSWGDDGVLLFEPHTRPVGCMAFSTTHPANLLSLSYDGSLRCMDVEKAVFEEVYDIEDGLKTFDFLSHDCSTLVVGNWFGDVAIVDRRTPGASHESLHTLDTKALRCVSVHPLHKHYFVVAENRMVSVYDSRCLKRRSSQPVSQLHGHSMLISGAYFSPITGNRVLTSCMDNNIRIYDTSAMTSTAPLRTTIRHDMQTGRWLTKLSAVWDPKREDCFAVGSMARPRRVDVYHEGGELQHSFRDDHHLTTVLSVTAFHPSRNALLGGNASGRLHVFSD